MQAIDIVVSSEKLSTVRVRQLESLFDIPERDRSSMQWRGATNIDEKEWSVGLIVGPSGCGKSTILRTLFREPAPSAWRSSSVIDDFESGLSIEAIAEVCQSVGFNTIPAWMRPFSVLSNGEKFRVEIARRLLEDPSPIVVDEFTSVVDRDVARTASHSIQKYVRRAGLKFVAASCHYDIVDWLQPDWIFEPATMSTTWRSLRRRPAIDIAIRRVPYRTWRLFAPFHYLTADLNPAACCYGLFAFGRVVSFAGVLHRPHPYAKNIKACSRVVTLPDWQGLGLAFILLESLAAAYRSLGCQFHMYPSHPMLARAFDRSRNWALTRKPGRLGKADRFGLGMRPCAVFRYVGEEMESALAARSLIENRSV